jgi:hypothetical protein
MYRAVLLAPMLAWAAGCGRAEPPADPAKAEAWEAARGFVVEKLAVPSTARFEAPGDRQGPERCVERTGEGSYTVSGWVESQNRIGATLRSDFVCKLRRGGDGKWQLEGLTLDER